jgi:hypothetical protein
VVRGKFKSSPPYNTPEHFNMISHFIFKLQNPFRRLFGPRFFAAVREIVFPLNSISTIFCPHPFFLTLLRQPLLAAAAADRHGSILNVRPDTMHPVKGGGGGGGSNFIAGQ